MTVEDTELIQVRNLCDHSVVYTSYLGQRRFFEKEQMMGIPANELRQLNYTKGGRVLLQDYLSVRNKELAEELGIRDYDHEYSWTLDDINRVLTTGSSDELEDALEFAPEGIVEAIVNQAVELPLADHNKRELIKKWTDKDVNAMIANAEAVKESIGNEATGAQRVGSNGTRRVKSTENAQEETPQRKGRRVNKTITEEE